VSTMLSKLHGVTFACDELSPEEIKKISIQLQAYLTDTDNIDFAG